MSSNDYNPQVLVEARERAGLTKSEAARRLNTYYMAVYRAERGKETSLSRLKQMCLLYGISLSDLLYFTTPRVDHTPQPV